MTDRVDRAQAIEMAAKRLLDNKWSGAVNTEDLTALRAALALPREPSDGVWIADEMGEPHFVELPPEPSVQFTDEMMEGLACWLLKRDGYPSSVESLPIYDEYEVEAREALEAALSSTRKEGKRCVHCGALGTDGHPPHCPRYGEAYLPVRKEVVQDGVMRPVHYPSEEINE
jgi:hypothetical protein